MKRFWIVRFAVALAGGIAGSSTESHAQNYPWCLAANAYEGGVNCGFDTEAQCRESLAGMGGFCEKNPDYRPEPQVAEPAAPAVSSPPLPAPAAKKKKQ